MRSGMFRSHLRWMDVGLPGTCQTTGLETLEEEISFSIVPNPATRKISFSLHDRYEENKGTVFLYDAFLLIKKPFSPLFYLTVSQA